MKIVDLIAPINSDGFCDTFIIASDRDEVHQEGFENGYIMVDRGYYNEGVRRDE